MTDDELILFIKWFNTIQFMFGKNEPKGSTDEIKLLFTNCNYSAIIEEYKRFRSHIEYNINIDMIQEYVKFRRIYGPLPILG